MAIDFHTHLGWHALYADEFLAGLLEDGRPERRAAVLRSARLWLADECGDRLVREIDAAGLARAVVLMIDGSVRFEQSSLDLERAYDVHARLLARHGDRLVVFGGVDPRRGGALPLFTHGVIDLGFRGMKLYPPMGFSVLDRRLEPFLDVCARCRLPVLTHSGAALPGLDAAFASPSDVAELARRRPEIEFVMAHGGFALTDSEVRRAIETGNVTVDVAGFQAHAARFGWDATRRELARAFAPWFNERVVFGSDYPLFHFSARLADDIARLRSVFDDLPAASEQAWHNVMTSNAERLLGLAVSAVQPALQPVDGRA